MECLGLEEASSEVVDVVAKLEQLFSDKFNSAPQFYVRAPGRVNLIGEHVDYSGYSVLPMALRQHIMVAVARSRHTASATSSLSMCNTHVHYQPVTVAVADICGDISSSSSSLPSWSRYVAAGVRGVVEHFQLDMARAVGGLQLAVCGCVPPSSGLSSSSALVCAAAIATAHANQVSVDRHVMAELCARAETFVGTQGGGMDQAVCLLARKGCAHHIEFSPLRVHSVTLPRGATFVIANCLAEKNKAASSEYNCRVVECRLACHVLAKHCGLKWNEFRRLGELQTHLGKSFVDMIRLTEQVLEKSSYSKAEVCAILETDETQLNGKSLTSNTLQIDCFKLRQRALHVFSEADRVWQFRRVCESVEGGEGGESALRRLGQLMSASHASCRDLYECSHARLDLLCQLAAPFAYGARLTGAGWGGCCVALLPDNRVAQFINHLKTQFYGDQLHCDSAVVDSAVFASQPEDGAQIFAHN